MSDHRIDKIFQQSLSDGTMMVPENLWNAIEPHLPSPRKRDRWGLIWIIGASGLLLSAIAAWWILADASGSIETQSLKTEVSSSSSPSLDATSSGSANTPPQLSSSAESQQVTIALDNLSQNSPQRNSLQTNNSLQHKNSNAQYGAQNDNATGDNSATLAESETIGAPEFVSESLLINTSVSETKNNTIPVGLRMSHVLLLSPYQRKLPDPVKDCYRFGKKNSGSGGILFAEGYIGPVLSSRKLSSRVEDVSSYIESRDSTESSRLSWNAGLRLGYWHHSGITVRIGGHYTQVNELFEYFNGSSTGSIIISDTIRDAQGNIIEIQPDTILVSGQRIKKTHNRYHTIDIPLLLGYQIAHDRWAYGIHAGPVFNVAFIRKGDILAPDGTPVSISSDNANEYPAYRDKLGLSIYASAHLGYRIGYRMWAYAEPYFQRRLSSLTLETYPIDQRQTNIGLSLGVRMNLQ